MINFLSGCTAIKTIYRFSQV
uniref:Uncharacterized protein n=1 Tax=Arundo donax TaxID=35708 RepID=A0A0A9BBC8_ARUDO